MYVYLDTAVYLYMHKFQRGEDVRKCVKCAKKRGIDTKLTLKSFVILHQRK